jgi:hypothetical protein
MGANELQNRVEAAAWVRVGPGDAPLAGLLGQPVAVAGTPNPVGYRSMVGFSREILVTNPADPFADLPFFMILRLEKEFVRAETVIQFSGPHTADMQPSSPNAGVAYPVGLNNQWQVFPVRFAFFEAGGITPPLSQQQVLDNFERYDSLICTCLTDDLNELGDLCVQILTAPRFDGVSMLNPIPASALPSP